MGRESFALPFGFVLVPLGGGAKAASWFLVVGVVVIPLVVGPCRGSSGLGISPRLGAVTPSLLITSFGFPIFLFGCPRPVARPDYFLFLIRADTFFENQNRCVVELKSEHFHHEVVKRAVVNSLDKPQESRNSMCSLLSYLATQEVSCVYAGIFVYCYCRLLKHAQLCFFRSFRSSKLPME